MRLLLIILFLASCANYKVKEFNLYTQTIVDKVSPYPTLEELKERIKVVVVIDDQTNVDIPNFNQKQIAAASLSELLQNLKSVDIIDRGIIKNIKEEAMLSEIKSGKPISGNKDADFVLLIKMNSLIFSSEYIARTGAKIGYSALSMAAMIGTAVLTEGRGIYINGGENPISGIYEYASSFNGEISIIQLPSGEVIKKIPLKANANSDESAFDGGFSKAKEFDPKLMEQVIKEAISNVTPSISKVVPAVGHIIYRSDYKPEEPTLFKATFGKSDGIQIGDKVNLQRKIYETNPLNNEQQISINNIPLGVIIANEFSDNFCWIKVVDKFLASTVKIAEKVTVNVSPHDDEE